MSNTADSDLPTAIALLQAELTRLREASAGAWHSYLTWFTWFFSTQVVLLGWVVLRKPDVPDVRMVCALAAVLITLNLLGVIAALRHRAFSRLQSRRADAICESLSACAQRSGVTIEITSGFANDLVHSALGVFSVALAIGVAVCLFIVATQLPTEQKKRPGEEVSSPGRSAPVIGR